MFDFHTVLIVSLLLGVFIGVGKFLRNPLLFFGSLSASGLYVFLLLHNAYNALLDFLKLVALAR